MPPSARAARALCWKRALESVDGVKRALESVDGVDGLHSE